MESHVFDYYLSLLQVQMAVLGIVVAGLVALIQTLGSVVPKRNVTMLASPVELMSFGGFLMLQLCVLALATWVTAFPGALPPLMTLFTDRIIGVTLLLVCLAGFLWFLHLIYRTRRLLNAHLYLTHYINTLPTQAVHEYVTTVYGTRAADHASKYASRNGFREVHDFREQLEFMDDLYDPFQPIREYIKHNAQQQFDRGTATGLRLFGALYDKAFTALPASDSQTSLYLTEHLATSATEFFRVFHKTSSEKRKLDVIRLVYAKGCASLSVHNDAALLATVRALEDMGEMSLNDDETVMLIECVQDLTNSYLDLYDDATWNDIGGVFEQICLSMTRLAEGHYLRADQPARSVPLVSYYTGKNRDVSVSFVNFFMGYRGLAMPHKGARPKLYFDAVEALCESLHARIAQLHDNGQAAIGLNRNYHTLTTRLYRIYEDFSREAIERNEPELFTLGITNLRRVMRSANNLNLTAEKVVIASAILDLIAQRSTSKMADAKIKNRTAADFVAELFKEGFMLEEREDVLAGVSKRYQKSAIIKAIESQIR